MHGDVIAAISSFSQYCQCISYDNNNNVSDGDNNYINLDNGDINCNEIIVLNVNPVIIATASIT